MNTKLTNRFNDQGKTSPRPSISKDEHDIEINDKNLSKVYENMI